MERANGRASPTRRTLREISGAAAGGIEEQRYQDGATGNVLWIASNGEPKDLRESTRRGLLDRLALNGGPYGEKKPWSVGTVVLLPVLVLRWTSIAPVTFRVIPSFDGKNNVLGTL